MTQTTRTIRPVSSNKSRKMTYEEFLRWDGEDQHVEWVDGEIVEMSPVSRRHQDILAFLLTILNTYVNQLELGKVYMEPFQMKTGPNLPGRAPDILYVSSKNLTRLKKNYVEGPADLVIEIVSPDDPKRDTVQKFAEYQEGGVPEYWLINPMTKQARFYIFDEEGRYKLSEPDASGRYCSKVMADFWIDVSWLWQENPPTVLSVLKEWGLV